MDTSTYYLLPGEREEGDNSGLRLIYCVNLGEVMFSFIKKEKKECLFSAPSPPSARQPELGCANEIHSVYSRPEPGRIAPRRDESLEVWQLASPWLPWRQSTECEGGTKGSAGGTGGSIGREMLLLCTHRPGPPRCAAPEGMGASPCPQWGVRILPPPPCRAGDKQGCEVSQPLWLSC